MDRSLATCFCFTASFILWASVSGTTAQINGEYSDGATLLSLKASWGLNYSSWVGDNPCKDWQGVQCDSNQRVITLNLSNSGISGPIPQEIGNLDHLKNLDLSNQRGKNTSINTITGDLSALGTLINLQSLNLSMNNVTSDTFPSSVLNLTNLTDLRLDNNYISGPLPKELSKLSKLEIVYLGNNTMTGLPAELGSLVNLQELSLWNNNLESVLPLELGQLVNLRYLNLHNCNLNGGLPKEFGNLKQLQNMSLYSNSLTGIIPDSWGNLTQIRKLLLYGNYLTKNIPSSVLQLPNLYNLTLSHNLLYGDLKISDSKATAILVTCNYFNGSLPLSSPALNDSGNCFMGTQSDSNDKIKCEQSPYHDCSSFFDALTKGGCPLCPYSPAVQDPETCVCTITQGSQGGSNSRLVVKLVGSIVGVLAFLIFVSGCVWFIRRKKLSSKDIWEGPDGVQRYIYRDLCKATENFSSRREIGHGGFGKVFWGVVNGRMVAIKQPHSSSVQSSTGFRNEVILLSRLHHRNLVRLLGFCEDKNSQILVFEYMPNGNLYDLLLNDREREKLDWLKRIDIAIEVAQGLEYLHSFADPPVIHRDVKPSNVLLDENMVAKLCDFGISKVASGYATHLSTKPAGTVGYIDPQYVLREQLTTASDVYSFGMVLLELITGQKSIDSKRLDDHNLAEWAKLQIKEGDYMSVVDPLLDKSCPEEVCQKMIQLAMECTSFNSVERPSMKEVLLILQACSWAVAPYVIHNVNETSLFSIESDQKAYEKYNQQYWIKKSLNSYSESTSSASEASTLIPR